MPRDKTIDGFRLKISRFVEETGPERYRETIEIWLSSFLLEFGVWLRKARFTQKTSIGGWFCENLSTRKPFCNHADRWIVIFRCEHRNTHPLNRTGRYRLTIWNGAITFITLRTMDFGFEWRYGTHRMRNCAKIVMLSHKSAAYHSDEIS